MARRGSLLLALGAMVVLAALLGAATETMPRTRRTLMADVPQRLTTGLADIEPDGDRIVRWILEPDAELVVPPAARPSPAISLAVIARTPRPGRQMTVGLNQRPLGRLALPAQDGAVLLPRRPLPAEARVALQLSTDRSDVIAVGIVGVDVTTGGLSALSREGVPYLAGQACLFFALFLVVWAAVSRASAPHAPSSSVLIAVGLGCAVLLAVALVYFRFELHRVVVAWGPRSVVLGLIVFAFIHPSAQALVERGRQTPAGAAVSQQLAAWERSPRVQTWRGRAPVIVSVALTAACGVYLLNLLRQFYVEVPIMDAWEMVPLVEKTYLGTATLHDFWMQANEHRPLFPRLILTPLARITGWDTRVEVALNFSLAIAVLLTAGAYLRSVTGRRTPFWAVPLCALFVFGPNQLENWLWGWQFLVFLQVACGIVGLYLLSKPDEGWRRFALALALGFVGTYSFANGLVFWVVGPLLIVLAAWNRKPVRLAVWGLVALLVIGSYFYGWRPNPGHPDPWRNFESYDTFVYLLEFFSIYIGTPAASYGMTAAKNAGIAGLVLFACCTVLAMRKPRLLLFPFAIALYAILGGGLTSLGRTGFGLPIAMSSRYVTLCGPLWIAIALFLVSAAHEWAGRPAGALARIVAAVVAATALVSWSHSERDWRWWQAQLAPAREALRVNGDVALQMRLYPHPSILAERRAMLQRRGLSVFRP